jgi:hypothetical protein
LFGVDRKSRFGAIKGQERQGYQGRRYQGQGRQGRRKAGTKLALLTEMVSGKGATTAELCKALGWQPHTLRAAICRLPIKPKHTRVDGVTSYRIGA